MRARRVALVIEGAPNSEAFARGDVDVETVEIEPVTEWPLVTVLAPRGGDTNRLFRYEATVYDAGGVAFGRGRSEGRFASGVVERISIDVASTEGCGDTESNTDNCGACGNTCSSQNGTAACERGRCDILCAAGWGDCRLEQPGCETELASSQNHCGRCDAPCNGVCRAGVCFTPDGGPGDIDGGPGGMDADFWDADPGDADPGDTNPGMDADTGRVVTLFSNEVVNIPDMGMFVSSSIEASEFGTVTSFTLMVNLTHSYPQDLRLELGFGGTHSFQFVGGSGNPLMTTNPSYSSGVVNLPGAGSWRLSVIDEAPGDVGTLDGWTLELTLAP